MFKISENKNGEYIAFAFSLVFIFCAALIPIFLLFDYSTSNDVDFPFSLSLYNKAFIGIFFGSSSSFVFSIYFSIYAILNNKNNCIYSSPVILFLILHFLLSLFLGMHYTNNIQPNFLNKLNIKDPKNPLYIESQKDLASYINLYDTNSSCYYNHVLNNVQNNYCYTGSDLLINFHSTLDIQNNGNEPIPKLDNINDIYKFLIKTKAEAGYFNWYQHELKYPLHETNDKYASKFFGGLTKLFPFFREISNLKTIDLVRDFYIGVSVFLAALFIIFLFLGYCKYSSYSILSDDMPTPPEDTKIKTLRVLNVLSDYVSGIIVFSVVTYFSFSFYENDNILNIYDISYCDNLSLTFIVSVLTFLGMLSPYMYFFGFSTVRVKDNSDNNNDVVYSTMVLVFYVIIQLVLVILIITRFSLGNFCDNNVNELKLNNANYHFNDPLLNSTKNLDHNNMTYIIHERKWNLNGLQPHILNNVNSTIINIKQNLFVYGQVSPSMYSFDDNEYNNESIENIKLFSWLMALFMAVKHFVDLFIFSNVENTSNNEFYAEMYLMFIILKVVFLLLSIALILKITLFDGGNLYENFNG